MNPASTKVPREVVADICRQYRQTNPRVGTELDAFVDGCVEYYRLSYPQVAKIIGNLQAEIDAQFRAQDKTTAQKTYDVMGLNHAEAAEKAKQLLHHKRKRIRTDSKGNTVLDENQNPVFDEWDDAAIQIKALREVNLMIGGHAPQQIQVEGSHHHLIQEISPSKLEHELRKLERSHGVKLLPPTIEADFSDVPEGSGGDAARPSPVAAGNG